MIRKFEFPPLIVNNLFKFAAHGSDFAPCFGNLTKVKIPSEIKPPLALHFLEDYRAQLKNLLRLSHLLKLETEMLAHHF